MENKLARMLGKGKPNVKTPEQESRPSAPPAGSESPQPANAAPTKPKLAGLKLNGIAKAPAVVAQTGGTQPRPNDGGNGTVDSGGASKGPSGGTALSLDDLENSEDPGTHRPIPSGFSDEVPATKPLRDLSVIDAEADEAIRKGMASFAELIDGVFLIIDDAEMLGNVIRSIMMELKANPQYMKLVQDDDVRAWIQGMRDSMGLQKIKKEARKTSRKGGASKNVDADMMADLDSLIGGDLGI